MRSAFIMSATLIMAIVATFITSVIVVAAIVINYTSRISLWAEEVWSRPAVPRGMAMISMYAFIPALI